MRPQESIHIAAAGAMLLLAFFRPLGSRRRGRILLLGVVPLFAILVARFEIAGAASRIVRDWLPAALLLIPYWQAGQFFPGPDARIQNRLLAADARFFARFPRLAGSRGAFWAAYFETAYLVCYPLVPLGFGVLLLTHHSSAANFYWSVVVLASDICFLCTIFVPALPPRVLPGDFASGAVSGNEVRALNLAVLNRGSIHAITFPSAHVASTMAAALVLLRVAPACGAAFLIAAVSIALGALLGRYHYAWDVAAGALLAAGVFLASLFIF